MELKTLLNDSGVDESLYQKQRAMSTNASTTTPPVNTTAAPTASPTQASTTAPSKFDYSQVNAAYKQFKMGDNRSPTNGASPQLDIRETRPTQLAQGVSAALKTIERYKTGAIRNEIPLRDGNFSPQEFPEQPFLLQEVYETPPNTWPSIWKPELLERTYTEMLIRDQKTGKDAKRRISEFKYHVDNLQATGEDEIWFAKDIQLMHTLSCLNSKKNKNCMGCSNYWKCVQTIQDDVRPWGNSDLLHYEPGHTETFLGHISMNGSHSPYQREVLCCDLANTLFYSDDPAGVAIWGLISPGDVHKLSEEDCLGVQFYDYKTFVDPAVVEKKLKVTYAVQRCGQTIIIPSGWIHWSVKVGRGLSFSGSWNFLRLKHVAEARLSVEFHRTLALFRPINVASLVISSAYQKLDEYEYVENSDEKRAIVEFLFKILPILRVLVLEEILGEQIALSGLVVLSYDQVVDKFRKNGRNRLPSIVTSELMQIRTNVISTSENDVIEDDEDVQYSCFHCKYILFNSRRSCQQCKGYDLCEPCFALHGRGHAHKLKRFRKIAIPNLIELVDSISAIVVDQEDILDYTAAMSITMARETREVVSPTKPEPRSVVPEPKNPNPNPNPPPPPPPAPVVEPKAEKDKDYKPEPREVPKRRRKEKEATPPLHPQQQQQQGIPGENYDSEVIDCICGNNKDLGFMISCEKCLAWLHGKCVGISKRNEPEEYYCPRCVKKTIALNSAAKLTPKSYSPERKLKEYKLA